MTQAIGRTVKNKTDREGGNIVKGLRALRHIRMSLRENVLQVWRTERSSQKTPGYKVEGPSGIRSADVPVPAMGAHRSNDSSGGSPGNREQTGLCHTGHL